MGLERNISTGVSLVSFANTVYISLLYLNIFSLWKMEYININTYFCHIVIDVYVFLLKDIPQEYC